MPASYASEPDSPAPLSPREKRILAAIEDELWDSDPEFGLRMAAGAPRPGPSWTVGGYGTASAVVLLLLVFAAALSPAWRAILGLVLTLGVLPCLVLWRWGRNTSKE